MGFCSAVGVELGAVAFVRVSFFPGKRKGMLKLIELDLDVAAQNAVVECLTFYSVHCW